MRYICTYFDINFLPRGMALIDSLDKYADDYTLYILALDTEVIEYFEKLKKKNINLITVNEYIEYFKIDKSKYSTQKEFYFSLTAGLCLYLLKNNNFIDLLLYLDADVYLFNNIDILYNEIGNYSISICSQRLPWYNSKKYGLYNVGVNSFRNDEEGLKCLINWHTDCISWEKGQKNYKLDFFSDQIWLDNWPSKYKNIKIIEHIGINTAPWNVMNYKITDQEGEYYINDKPLVIYHFSSLKYLGNNEWHGNTSFTILNIKNVLFSVYNQYLLNVNKYLEYNQMSNTLKIDFSGNKIKYIIYNLLKYFHKHTIKVEKGI